MVWKQDVPDVEGDRDHGVRSFSVLVGKETVSRTNTYSVLFFFRFNGCQEMSAEEKNIGYLKTASELGKLVSSCSISILFLSLIFLTTG